VDLLDPVVLAGKSLDTGLQHVFITALDSLPSHDVLKSVTRFLSEKHGHETGRL